jgi:hypothetical protein
LDDRVQSFGPVARFDPGAAEVWPRDRDPVGQRLMTLAIGRSSTWARALGRAEFCSNIERPSWSTSWMRRPSGVWSMISCFDSSASSGIDCMA